MMYRARTRVPAVFGGVLMGAVALGAGESQAETLRFCYEDWAPYSAMTDNGSAGIEITLTNAALATMGHDATYDLLPYKRCVAEVERGSYDAMLLTDTEPTLFPNEVTTAYWIMGFFVSADSPLTGYESLDAFSGMTLGVVDGYEYPEHLDEVADLKREAVASPEINLHKLAAGRIDLVLDDVPWVQSVIAKQGLGLRLVTPLLTVIPEHTYFSPARKDLIPAFDAAMSTLLQDGTVDRVYQEALGMTFSTLTENLTTFADGS